jgi:hypothetical protein
VLVECRADPGDGVRVQFAAEVQASDFGADAGAELAEFELGFGDDSHCFS